MQGGPGWTLPRSLARAGTVQAGDFPTPEALGEWCLERCLRIRGLIRRQRTDSAGRTVERAKEFILEHYRESGLSVERLCDYLRGMMRVSDAAYYQVIKDADLQKEGISPELELLYQSNRDHIVSIAVFTEEGKLEAAAPVSRLKPGVTPQTEGWFSAARERIENLHFSTPHVQDLFVDPDHRYRWVVSLSRQVELTRGGAVEKGVLLVDMNYGGIEQICKDVDLGSDQGYLYLVDGEGEIIYHPRQQLIYARLLEENNQAAADLNVELRFLLPASPGDGEEQRQLLHWEVENGAAAILLFPADRGALAVEQAACLEDQILPEEMPFIVEVDATPPALAAMADGTLKGTVQNDARGQAECILELCFDLAAGAEPSPEKITDGHYIWLWYAAVTQENLAEFLP